MKNTYHGRTDSTPEVELDIKNKTLNIIGISIPINPMEFYGNIYELVENSNLDSLTININLSYLDSTSCKTIYILLKKIIKLNMTIIVNWSYEEDDEDMFDTIIDFECLLELPINRITLDGDDYD